MGGAVLVGVDVSVGMGLAVWDGRGVTVISGDGVIWDSSVGVLVGSGADSLCAHPKRLNVNRRVITIRTIFRIGFPGTEII